MSKESSRRVLRTAARGCFDAALASVDPRRLVGQVLDREGDVLRLETRDGVLSHRGPLLLVAAGKAALGMAHGSAAVARPDAGIVIVPHGVAGDAPPGTIVLHAAHPVPDDAGERATARVLDAVRSAGPETLVLLLLSGGASALLVAPAGDITLADTRAVTAALLASGADIVALNAVRKHCSRVQGGGLARAARGAAGVWTLLLSDVAGDDPAIIASGPAAADPTTFADARHVLERWLEPEAVPTRVRAHLDAGVAGRVAETVKPGDPVLDRVATHVLAGNRTAVKAAAAAAHRLGFEAHEIPEPLRGDAEAAGGRIVATLESLPRQRPVAIVAGGETTVRVVPGGRGGRSQHLALAAALALAGRPGVVLAAGTDGIDGPTEDAGACVDGGTVARGRARNLDAAAALAATDSNPLLAATGDLVRTGPTGTNVADLVVALRPAC
jgi:glycerate 2-kinase